MFGERGRHLCLCHYSWSRIRAVVVVAPKRGETEIYRFHPINAAGQPDRHGHNNTLLQWSWPLDHIMIINSYYSLCNHLMAHEVNTGRLLLPSRSDSRSLISPGQLSGWQSQYASSNYSYSAALTELAYKLGQAVRHWQSEGNNMSTRKLLELHCRLPIPNCSIIMTVLNMNL